MESPVKPMESVMPVVKICSLPVNVHACVGKRFGFFMFLDNLYSCFSMLGRNLMYSLIGSLVYMR